MFKYFCLQHCRPDSQIYYWPRNPAFISGPEISSAHTGTQAQSGVCKHLRIFVDKIISKQKMCLI